jgi:hypothetical protein
MRIRELFGALALSMLLSGCMDSNPLEKHPPDKVASFIMEHGNLSITRCSEIWAHPESANKTGLQDCDRTATHIANLLNEGGFGPNVTFENVRFTPIWTEYEAMLEVRRKKGKEDLKKVFDWGPDKQ